MADNKSQVADERFNVDNNFLLYSQNILLEKKRDLLL